LKVLGIDAAWTITQPSGVCLIESDDGYNCSIERIASSVYGFINNDRNTKPSGDEIDLKSILDSMGQDVNCIAVDMPLSENLIEGRRSCERSVSKYYGAKGAATHSPNVVRPGSVSVKLVKEANDLGYDLSLKGNEKSDKCLIEVYPHTSIIEYLNLEYRYEYKVAKKNKYKAWKSLKPIERNTKLTNNMNELAFCLGQRVVNLSDHLAILEPDGNYKGWQLKAYEDMIDSLVSALTGLDYLSGKTTGYGGKDGTIWIPSSDRKNDI